MKERKIKFRIICREFCNLAYVIEKKALALDILSL